MALSMENAREGGSTRIELELVLEPDWSADSNQTGVSTPADLELVLQLDRSAASVFSCVARKGVDKSSPAVGACQKRLVVYLKMSTAAASSAHKLRAASFGRITPAGSSSVIHHVAEENNQMKLKVLVAIPLAMLASSVGFAAPHKLSSADKNAAFKAAGYSLKGKEWRSECGLADDSVSYSPGIIEEARDINGDGRSDAIILEGGIGCYGNTGRGFSIVSKQADGSWKLMTANSGFVYFLKTKGADGWPDIEIVGPGFCDGVWRCDGAKYNYKCSKEQAPGGCSWMEDSTKICK